MVAVLPHLVGPSAEGNSPYDRASRHLVIVLVPDHYLCRAGARDAVDPNVISIFIYSRSRARLGEGADNGMKRADRALIEILMDIRVSLDRAVIAVIVHISYYVPVIV